MDRERLVELLESIASGDTDPTNAVETLAMLPFRDVGDALVDHHRTLRQGAPEAVYGPGKTPEQCVLIVGELLNNGTGPVLATRLSPQQRVALHSAHPGAAEAGGAMLWREPVPGEGRAGTDGRQVLVITAGTADIPVADEALLTLRSLGLLGHRLTDVGVAGLHRVLANLDLIRSAHAIIVVAGMEGALASVVGGLTSRPVVAVPTSVGYGSGLDGVTALLAMTASCASGITVVGIDNGFGAAVAIGRILRGVDP